MQIIETKEALQEALKNIKSNGQRVGFVPTMGALHQGHLSLVKQAALENDVVVCSIYVNPTQFTNAADLEKYPRTLSHDLAMLESVNCQIVYTPTTQDVYPEGAKSQPFNFGKIESIMEGKHRPGHFQGMATIVKRFFDIVAPDAAYFGEKDYQQLAIVKELVKQEKLNIRIVGCPILREADGLAMSSRNMRLTASQRHAAPGIYKALIEIKERAQMGKDLNKSIAKAIETINAHPALAVEYLEICNAETLEPIFNWADAEHAQAFIATYAGEVRLIDNLLLN